MPFEINAKNFFLTFPRCPLHPEYALAHFVLLFPEADFLGIAQEEHQDGTPHLHALVCLPRKKHIRNPRHFDLEFDGVEYHGNYQSARNPAATLEYIKKEQGAFASMGTPPQKGIRGSAYRTALDSSSTAAEFSSKLLELAPRDAVLYSSAITTFARGYYGGSGSGFAPTRSVSDFITPTPLKDWLDQEVCIYFRTPRDAP